MRLDLYFNEKSEKYLNSLGIKRDQIPRYRGCGIEDDKIVIHTRTGGGNREEYEEENDWLTLNKYYISDSDDDFDATYANFYFKIPSNLEEGNHELKKQVIY